MTTTDFHFFDGSRTDSTTPSIRLRPTGQMVLNSAALELLGDGTTHVQVGFNADTQTVALRSAPEGARGRYRLRKQGRSGRLVDSRRFFAHLELEIPKARSFEVESFGNDLVGFHLTEASEAVPADDKPAPAKKAATRRKGSKAA